MNANLPIAFRNILDSFGAADSAEIAEEGRDLFLRLAGGAKTTSVTDPQVRQAEHVAWQWMWLIAPMLHGVIPAHVERVAAQLEANGHTIAPNTTRDVIGFIRERLYRMHRPGN